MQFRDEVARLMSEIGLRGWKTVTATRNDVKHFGNAVVIVEKGNLQARIVRDRGVAPVEVAGLCKPDSFYTVGLALIGLRLTDDLESALNMAALLWPFSSTMLKDGLMALHDHEDVLQNALSALRWADTTARIDLAYWLFDEVEKLFKRRSPG